MLTYQLVLSEISKKKFASLYLFFGDEDYLIEDLIRSLASAYLGSDLQYGFDKIDGSEQPLNEVLIKLQSDDLFTTKRLMVIDDPLFLRPPRKAEQSGEDLEQNETSEKNNQRCDSDFAQLTQFCSDLEGNTFPERILILKAKKVDRRKRYYKYIDKAGVVVECASLKGERLTAWLQEKAKSLGKKIDRQAMDKLLLTENHSLHHLANELEKYSIYLGKEEDLITAELVDHLFSGDMQGNIFKLTDAITAGNLIQAHDHFEQLLQKREKPLQIFFMLARHYRLLLQACCLLEEGVPLSEYSAALSVHPYAAGKLREQAALCQPARLADILIALQNCDFQIKTGKLDPTDAVKLILSRIDYLQSK